jgi:hypothetical protein
MHSHACAGSFSANLSLALRMHASHPVVLGNCRQAAPKHQPRRPRGRGGHQHPGRPAGRGRRRQGAHKISMFSHVSQSCCVFSGSSRMLSWSLYVWPCLVRCVAIGPGVLNILAQNLLPGMQVTPSTGLATYTCLTVWRARQHTFALTAWEHSTVCQPEECCSALQVALSNSFGFGGHNSCVLFRKFEG